MSSGNRVLRDVIAASGIRCFLDRSHGTKDIQWRSAVVIVLRRDRTATDASREAAWAGHPDYVPYDASDAGIRHRYPHAPVVTYEALCAGPEATIEHLADLLGIDPWPAPVDLVDQNDKWRHGGGPQLGAGAPNNPGRDKP